MEVLAIGIPIEELQKRTAEIEAALNMKIATIKEGADCQHIIMCLAAGSAKLLEKIYLPKVNRKADDPKLVLGKSLFEEVAVNLDSTPHILVGGSTGSGKTTMLKVIILQALQKGWQVSLNIYVVLLGTGLRVAEFCGLTYKDLDFEQRRIKIDHQLLHIVGKGYSISDPKTASGVRYIPMTD